MHNILIALALFLAHALAAAADIHVVALTAGKAVVRIDGGKVQTLAVGQVSPEGVKLLSATSEEASFEFGGRRQTLAAGQGGAVASAAAPSPGSSVTLTADARGHFITTGVVNGVSLRFLVDTGATAVVLSGSDAKRAGINYRSGQKAVLQTANGTAPAYRVTLDTVRLGEITLNNVDGAVVEGNALGELSLLGLSVLNRLNMRREGSTMTLTRRF